jgi:2-polyprenyl-6-methoxyphenol hydroxylase-like FAD-dependent oxidoreductase
MGVLMPQKGTCVSSIFGERAVVAGAGIAGLSMAGALAGHFKRVDVLELDQLPASAESRFGTPQDRHPHVLMGGGLKALGEIFPGFENDLAQAGAVSAQLTRDVWYERADVGLWPARDLGLSMLFASRPLIEFVLRRRVVALSNVTLRQRCRVTRIIASPGYGVVRGVEFDSGSGRTETLEADLVADASGRAVPTLALLDELGWERPKVSEVGVDISYATAVLNKPADAPSHWKAVLVWPDPPSVSLNASLSPIEDDRWIVTVADYRRAAHIETWDGFLGALGQMVAPTIYKAVRDIEPPDSIWNYGFPASVWRHFELLPRWPVGVLPIGDSLCRTNPVHGQGMSVAARQARLLQSLLEAAGSRPDPLAAVSADFMAQVESVVRTPWDLSTSADLAFPTTRGKRSESFEEDRQSEAALFRAAVADPVIQKALLEVNLLLQPRSLLQHPNIIQRIGAAPVNKSWRRSDGTSLH